MTTGSRVYSGIILGMPWRALLLLYIIHSKMCLLHIELILWNDFIPIDVHITANILMNQ